MSRNSATGSEENRNGQTGAGQASSAAGSPPGVTVITRPGQVAREPGATLVATDTVPGTPAAQATPTLIGRAAEIEAAPVTPAAPTQVIAQERTEELHGGTATAATFISSPDAKPGDPAATMIGAPENKDMEDYFDTLVDDPEAAGSGKVKNAGFVIGDYLIVGELGRGGMGVVYKARHRKLNRIVALKMILAGKHSGNEALERFIAEARAVAHLQHPGIVQIFDIGEHQGLPYFSLEYVEGTDLHRDLNGQPRDGRRSAEMVEHLCVAMQYAHDNKILHRDLKPANVLLDVSGKPKITDFGLAKQVDAESSGQTSDGTIMGSPSYMPPEQARGELSSITPRSDLYSLGAILYQMLTGRPPFITDRPLDTVMQVVSNDPVQPRELQPGIPVDLETICMKALQKDQAQRYACCADLAADLRRFLNNEPILARPVSRIERAWRWCKRNPRVAVPSGIAGLFITATALIASWAWSATSTLAAGLKKERDTVTEQRDEIADQKAQVEVQRDEADRQRVLATEAQLQAEKNQKLAEQQALLALRNMQLIVTDIDDTLAAQAGTDEIRISLLQIVESKFDELDLALAGGIQGEAIPTLMTIRSKIAAAWTDLDKIAEADVQYQKIYAQGQQRLIDKGRLDAPRYNLALICSSWASIKSRLSGNPADAEPLLAEAAELCREIIRDPQPREGSPKPFEIVDVLEKTLLQSANGFVKKGLLAKAEAAYAEVGEWSGKILAEIDADVDWWTALPEDKRPVIRLIFQQYLDISRSGRANVLCRLGRVDEAIPIYEGVIERARASAASNPNARDQLALQLRNYGQYILKCGRTDDAARLLSEAHEIAASSYNADPANGPRKRSFGHSLYYLATARDAQQLAPDALVLFERSRALRAEMLATTPDKANKVNLMLSEAQVGNVDAAKALADELSVLEATDPDLRLDIARALAQLTRRTEGEVQTTLRDSALTALERAADDGLSDPFFVANEPDLIPLRGEARFAAVVARLTEVRDNLQAQR